MNPVESLADRKSGFQGWFNCHLALVLVFLIAVCDVNRSRYWFTWFCCCLLRFINSLHDICLQSIKKMSEKRRDESKKESIQSRRLGTFCGVTSLGASFLFILDPFYRN